MRSAEKEWLMSNLTDEREFLPSTLESVVASILAFTLLEDESEIEVLDEKLH